MSSWMHIRSHFHTNSSSIFTHVCQWVLVHMTLISILFEKKTNIWYLLACSIVQTSTLAPSYVLLIHASENSVCVRLMLACIAHPICLVDDLVDKYDRSGITWYLFVRNVQLLTVVWNSRVFFINVFAFLPHIFYKYIINAEEFVRFVRYGTKRVGSFDWRIPWECMVGEPYQVINRMSRLWVSGVYV